MFGLHLHAVQAATVPLPTPAYYLWSGDGAIEDLDGDDGPECLDRFAAGRELAERAKDGRDWTLWERRGRSVRLVAAYATDPETAERGLVSFLR